MSMPKGHKSKFGYATVKQEHGGMDYRQIAEKMTDEGHKMNHATARNIFLKAMKKLAAPVCDAYGDETVGTVDEISRDPRFQSCMTEMVGEIYDCEVKPC